LAKARFVTTKFGIFLGNVYDPLDLRIKWSKDYMNEGEDEFQARSRMIKWMITKTIGPPLATPEYEVSDLRGQGFVGVYFNEEAGDKEVSAEVVDATFPAGRTDVDFLGSAVWENYKIRHEWLE
jgi:hypothetical protein